MLENGKYRIEKLIGQGGFGITYLGEQVSLGRKVAIKEFFMKDLCNRDSGDSRVYTLSKGSTELVERYRAKFIKEARNLASLRHPNIVSVIDIFESNDTAYYVMEYHSGGSLADKVKNGPLAEADAVRYIRQAAAALDYIHARQIMHLDVKPANILLDDEDSVVLIDFGLAKQYDEAGHQTSATPVGISHGYAPMEQYRSGGVETFSPVVDIYSLGATLYKLVTGLTPPEASDIFDSGLPKLPTTLSAGVRSAIEKSMQPRRVERPQSIGEFLALLDSAKVAATAATNTAESVAKVVAPAAAPVVAPAAPAINCETMLNTDADAATSIAATADDAATSFAAPAADAATALASTPEAPAPAAKPAVHPVATPKMSDAERSAAIKEIVKPKKKGGKGLIKTFLTLVVLAALAVGGYFVWKYFINDELSLEEKMALMDKYDKISHFDENGLAQVEVRSYSDGGSYTKKTGFINKRGQEVVPCQYHDASLFSEGLCLVESDDEPRRIGFVDTNGNEVIPCQFEKAKDFSDGMAAVRKGDEWGFIDESGNLMIDYQFESVSNFHNGRALVANDGEIYFIDMYGSKVLYVDSCNYSWVNIHDVAGYFYYNDDRHERIIDSNGYELPFAYKYDRVDFLDYKSKESRVSPLFMAVSGTRTVLVDVNGNEVSGHELGDGDVGFGYVVKKNGKRGCLNLKGEEVVPCEYDYAWMISENMALVEQDDKYGIVNANNKIVVPIEYDRDDIHPYIGIEMIKVTSGGSTLYYDFEGNQVQR